MVRGDGPGLLPFFFRYVFRFSKHRVPRRGRLLTWWTHGIRSRPKPGAARRLPGLARDLWAAAVHLSCFLWVERRHSAASRSLTRGAEWIDRPQFRASVRRPDGGARREYVFAQRPIIAIDQRRLGKLSWSITNGSGGFVSPIRSTVVHSTIFSATSVHDRWVTPKNEFRQRSAPGFRNSCRLTASATLAGSSMALVVTTSSRCFELNRTRNRRFAGPTSGTRQE